MYGGGAITVTNFDAKAPTSQPTAFPTASPTKFVGIWNVVHKNAQKASPDMAHTFDKPITTQAIRVQRTGAIAYGWFRVTEIEAFGVDGKAIKAKGASTDNYYGGWRKSAWATELYDDNHNWGNDKGVHFQNHATVWFSEDVTIKSLKLRQANKYEQTNWQWEAYTKGYVYQHGFSHVPTPAPTKFPTMSPTRGSFIMPCTNPANGYSTTCPADAAARKKVQMTLETTGKCAESAGHSNWAKKVGHNPSVMLHCPIKPTVLIKNGATGPLTFTNQNGDHMEVYRVHHWAWGKNRIYFMPAKAWTTAAEANQVMYGGGAITVTNFDAKAPTSQPTAFPTASPTKFVGIWNVVHKNAQKASPDMAHTFDKPITTQAIRVQRTGAIAYGWFRVTEIEAFGVDGKAIKAKGASTDNYYGGWRKSAWATELYDDNHNWGNDKGVHFQNHATVWFSEDVTIKSLKLRQANKYEQTNWQWEAYTKGYVYQHGFSHVPTPAPTKFPTKYVSCGVDCDRSSWPVEAKLMAAGQNYKAWAKPNVYCAGTCGGCGMSAHQHGNGGVGCSCGKNKAGKWTHMYAKDATGKLHLSGWRTCPPGTHQPLSGANGCAEKCIPN